MSDVSLRGAPITVAEPLLARLGYRPARAAVLAARPRNGIRKDSARPGWINPIAFRVLFLWHLTANPARAQRTHAAPTEDRDIPAS